MEFLFATTNLGYSYKLQKNERLVFVHYFKILLSKLIFIFKSLLVKRQNVLTF